ncbi:MAG: 4Fe-4S binding protein, partial [Candidatus Binatia bacterium]
MTANWGLFLCNCRQTLRLNPEKLVLPIAPSVLSCATEPEAEIQQFAERAKNARLERVLIGCCMDAGTFEKAFADSASSSPKLHFLNLRESCFLPHADSEKAHAKATRLLRAAMECAEGDTALTYNPLQVGDTIVIACDPSRAKNIAARLQNIGRPVFILPRIEDGFPLAAHAGRVVEIKGRLGDFLVTIEELDGTPSTRREIKADQVVILASEGEPQFKARTGCHPLVNPSDAELGRLAERIRELIGDFRKLVHVSYNAAICAGGNADHESCGVCVTACPYEAISRDPANHLRMQVDHMACEGCGACVSACPTSALAFTEPSPGNLY